MPRITLLVFIITLVGIVAVLGTACGEGETIDYCPADCQSDNCPKNEKSVACPRPTTCPPLKCKCRFNYRRADNGTCIPTSECPPFTCKKPNEVYDPCPPLCPNGSCDHATPDGSCPQMFGQILIVLECLPRCRCKEGFWWNSDNVCVPYQQCPGKSKPRLLGKHFTRGWI